MRLLYLIDVSIYVFRGWQTLPPGLLNTHGEPANAVFGFAQTLADLLSRDERSAVERCVCAFDDCLRSGLRHDIYPPYKADRPAAPPELRVQFQRCRQVAEAFGLVCHGSQRVEADDIIGQLAQLAQAAGDAVTIVSADKDLAQYILGANDIYWDFARNRRLNRNDLHKRFKVRTDQIADWLALCGDKSDNIPGVPGVGEATAARLLKKWQTLDHLFAHVDEVAQMHFRGAPRIAELLPRYESQVRLARQLTGLIQDHNLPSSLDALTWHRRAAADIHAGLLAAGLPEATASKLAEQMGTSAAGTHPLPTVAQ